MAYLSEQLSRRDSGLAVKLKNNSAGSQAEKIIRGSDNSESANVQIARDLSEHKSRLTNALAQFPIAALWLLNEHETTRERNEADEENYITSDFGQALAEIKKYYQSLSRLVPTDAEHHQELELLQDCLQRFPYSFEDLVSITDIVASVYQHENTDKPSYFGLKAKQAGLALQKRRNRLSSQKISAFLTLSIIDKQHENFLFLTANERYEQAWELLIAEQLWLKARQELAKNNTRLVMFIANQYKSSFLDFDDLVQEGQTGLLKAVDKFDYRLGFQFSTYAGYWIRQAISRALSRSERLVRIPCGQVANINRVFRARTELAARSGQDPTIKELSDCTKLTEDEINNILTISQTAVSLENPDDNEDAFSPIDFLEQQVFTHAFETMAKNDLEQLLTQAVSCLNPREAKIICAHFGMDCDKEMTLQEIGTELNLTRERVRQIQVMALNKIKLNYGCQLTCFL